MSHILSDSISFLSFFIFSYFVGFYAQHLNRIAFCNMIRGAVIACKYFKYILIFHVNYFTYLKLTYKCVLLSTIPTIYLRVLFLSYKFTCEFVLQAIHEVQQKSNFKNLLLEKKLSALADTLEKKEAQLNEVLSASNLDPTALTVVTRKLEDVLDSKNSAIKVRLRLHVYLHIGV